ncbi:MAG: Spx/MgsR family RNA polymerase-binding regulatory protein [Opitutales bacterium]|nr:Spx/MgsR family RNA polymerase-binding regulatory protein [Opitutales bacterium]MCH8540954.1 Spx/MgsR family RNA polymerase-binding regulatory protein [Opitutales bacterium]
MGTTVYTYQKCSTCRKATDWLRSKGLSFEEKPIRETPPTQSELAQMLAYKDGEIRKLFNTSGMDYRALGLKDTLPKMSRDEAFALLRSNGNLVKRPFLLSDKGGAVGFREKEWEALF